MVCSACFAGYLIWPALQHNFATRQSLSIQQPSTPHRLFAVTALQDIHDHISNYLQVCSTYFHFHRHLVSIGALCRGTAGNRRIARRSSLTDDRVDEVINNLTNMHSMVKLLRESSVDKPDASRTWDVSVLLHHMLHMMTPLQVFALRKLYYHRLL